MSIHDDSVGTIVDISRNFIGKDVKKEAKYTVKASMRFQRKIAMMTYSNIAEIIEDLSQNFMSGNSIQLHLALMILTSLTPRKGMTYPLACDKVVLVEV